MTDNPSKSPTGLDALEARLTAKLPGYAEASKTERQIDAQCEQIRLLLGRQRRLSRISQTEIARRMGITQASVSRIESNLGDLGLSTLLRYADALGLAVSIELAPKELAAESKGFYFVRQDSPRTKEELMERVSAQVDAYASQLLKS